MIQHAVVVGAGVVGRCCALVLARAGHRVTLVDDGEEPCAARAGGMLAPVSEVDHAERSVVGAGLDSVARWQALLGPTFKTVGRGGGSVITALAPERPLLDQLVDRVVRAGLEDRILRVDRPGLLALEPSLPSRFVRGIHIHEEGALIPRDALKALGTALVSEGGEILRGQATRVGPGEVEADGALWRADRVVDARGLGARDALPLRGVRGEFLEVYAPEVALRHPLRVVHPRHPLYVVPRGDGLFYVGATEIEREDRAPMTVRSALDLLSLLYAVDPRFADAAIRRSGVGHRPALPDNAPRLVIAPGLIRVNGLHRHGWLLSPILAEGVRAAVAGDPLPEAIAPFVEGP